MASQDAETNANGKGSRRKNKEITKHVAFKEEAKKPKVKPQDKNPLKK